MTFLALVVMAALMACGSDGSDGAVDTDAGDDEGIGCSEVSAEDKQCEDATDCVAVTIPSCCITYVHGVNAENAQCFQEYENEFDGSSCNPDSGCASGVETDGGDFIGPEDSVEVLCEDSRCTAYIQR